MKTKLLKTIVPTIIGVFTVLFLLLMFNFIVYKNDVFNKPEDGLFTFFTPIVTIIAMLIQFFLTLPFWEKFKSQNKVWGLTLFQFSSLIIIVSGLAFGLVFWEKIFGFIDLLWGCITGIIAFTVYWMCNIITLKKLDKILK
jgi:hypothetical protein